MTLMMVLVGSAVIGFTMGLGVAVGMELVMRLSGEERTMILTIARGRTQRGGDDR